MRSSAVADAASRIYGLMHGNSRLNRSRRPFTCLLGKELRMLEVGNRILVQADPNPAPRTSDKDVLSFISFAQYTLLR